MASRSRASCRERDPCCLQADKGVNSYFPVCVYRFSANLLACLQDAEVCRLSAVEAAADRLRTQLAAADAAVGEKDATLSLLLSDKAYLSKEVQVGTLLLDAGPTA